MTVLYVLLKAFDRARGTGPQGTNQWGDAIFGHKQYPVWGVKCLVQ